MLQESDGPDKYLKQQAAGFLFWIFALLLVSYLLFLFFVSFYVPDFISPRRVAGAGAGEMFFLAGEFRIRWWNLRDISNNILLYMPLGFLVAMTVASSGKAIRTGVMLSLGFLISIGAETVQAFIGRFSDATDVMSNTGGYLLGFYTAVAVVALAENSQGVGNTSSGSFSGTVVRGGSPSLPMVVALCYLLLLLALSLSPYDFDVSPQSIRDKLLHETNFLPFGLHLSSRPLVAAIDVLREMILFAPFGALLATRQRRPGDGLSMVSTLKLVGGVGLCLALWIESLQLTVVARYVDITDVLLATMGCLAGAVLALLFAAQIKPGVEPGRE